MRKAYVIVAAVGIALPLVAVAVAGVVAVRTLPTLDGLEAVDGLHETVEIVRDANAIPHIFANNAHDAYFALGYVHAQDRMWQMEFTRRLGAGRLAEVLGERTLEIDRFIRTLGLDRLAEARFAEAPPEVRAAFEAYAAGVNAWLERGSLPPEFLLLGFEPEAWQPTDSVVWAPLMALRLGRNWRLELLSARVAQRLADSGIDSRRFEDLWPPHPADTPITVATAERLSDVSFERLWDGLPLDSLSDGASNTWVVHSTRTATGKPILANDPHLGFDAPVRWYLARIEAPDLTLVGATVPGVPFMILGHNGEIAWGFTNGRADAADLFVERLAPSDPDRYLTADGSRQFSVREEVILVDGSDPVTITVRESMHGPIISDVSEDAAGIVSAGHVISLTSASLWPDDRTAVAQLGINRARNWSEFRAAAGNIHTPHLNLFFAARDGEIAMISPGRIPIRRIADPRLPVAGDQSGNEWLGFVPTEALPQARNPDAGYIANANNRVIGEAYPYHLTNDWAMGFRAQRIESVLSAQGAHRLTDSQNLQTDIRSLGAQMLLPILLANAPESERSARALGLLSAWDFEMCRDAPEPLIYTAWVRQLVGALADDELGEDLVADYLGSVYTPTIRFIELALTSRPEWCDDIATPQTESCEDRVATALEDALDEVAALEGGSDIDDWRWGRAHRALRPILTEVPLIGRWADLTIDSGGGNETVSAGTIPGGRAGTPFDHVDGAGFRAVYDLADLDRSEFVIATGQSGNFLSAHYGDFLQRWRDGRYVRIAGSREELEQDGVGRLVLGPSDR